MTISNGTVYTPAISQQYDNIHIDGVSDGCFDIDFIRSVEPVIGLSNTEAKNNSSKYQYVWNQEDSWKTTGYINTQLATNIINNSSYTYTRTRI